MAAAMGILPFSYLCSSAFICGFIRHTFLGVLGVLAANFGFRSELICGSIVLE
jgi:hypothetical protein